VRNWDGGGGSLTQWGGGWFSIQRPKKEEGGNGLRFEKSNAIGVKSPGTPYLNLQRKSATQNNRKINGGGERESG